MSAAAATSSASYRPVYAKNNASGAPLASPKSKPVVRLATCDIQGIAAFNAAIGRKEHKTFADLERIIKTAHDKILCTKEKTGACMLYVYLQAVVEVIQEESAPLKETQRAGGMVAKCDNSAQAMITRAVEQVRASMDSIPEYDDESETLGPDLFADDVDPVANPGLHHHLKAVETVVSDDLEREFANEFNLVREAIEVDIADEIVDRLMADLVKGAMHPIHKIQKKTAATAPQAVHLTAAAAAFCSHRKQHEPAASQVGVSATAAALAPERPTPAASAASKNAAANATNGQSH